MLETRYILAIQYIRSLTFNDIPPTMRKSLFATSHSKGRERLFDLGRLFATDTFLNSSSRFSFPLKERELNNVLFELLAYKPKEEPIGMLYCLNTRCHMNHEVESIGKFIDKVAEDCRVVMEGKVDISLYECHSVINFKKLLQKKADINAVCLLEIVFGILLGYYNIVLMGFTRLERIFHKVKKMGIKENVKDWEEHVIDMNYFKKAYEVINHHIEQNSDVLEWVLKTKRNYKVIHTFDNDNEEDIDCVLELDNELILSRRELITKEIKASFKKDIEKKKQVVKAKSYNEYLSRNKEISKMKTVKDNNVGLTTTQSKDIHNSKENIISKEDIIKNNEEEVRDKDNKQHMEELKDKEDQAKEEDIKDEGNRNIEENDKKDIKDTNQDEEGIKDANQDPERINNAKQDEANIKDTKQDKGDVKDTKQDREDINDAKQDEGDIKNAKQDEGNINDAEQDEGSIKDAKQDEGNINDAGQDEGDIKDAKQDEGDINDAEQDEGDINEAKQDENKKSNEGNKEGMRDSKQDQEANAEEDEKNEVKSVSKEKFASNKESINKTEDANKEMIASKEQAKDNHSSKNNLSKGEFNKNSKEDIKDAYNEDKDIPESKSEVHKTTIDRELNNEVKVSDNNEIDQVIIEENADNINSMKSKTSKLITDIETKVKSEPYVKLSNSIEHRFLTQSKESDERVNKKNEDQLLEEQKQKAEVESKSDTFGQNAEKIKEGFNKSDFDLKSAKTKEHKLKQPESKRYTIN